MSPRKSEPDESDESDASPTPTADSPADDAASAEPSASPDAETAAQPAAERSATKPQLDREGRERPAFLLKFPNDAELSKLVTAFEQGNYAFVRAHAEQVAEQASSERVRRAALDLRRRIDPDPLVKYLLLISVLLLLTLVLFAYHHH